MQIVFFPHPTLRYESKPIKRVDTQLRGIVQEMFQLMYAAKGIGLAANQVDLPLRLFIVNLASDPAQGEEMVFINPVVSRPKGSEEAEEGCLSLPGVHGHVIRPAQVRVNAYDFSGQEFSAEVDGMLVRVVQHELDHLDGVVFPDRMNSLGQLNLKPALDEFESKFRIQRETGEIPDDAVIRQQLAEWEARYC